jgi:hypothetical protein
MRDVRPEVVSSKIFRSFVAQGPIQFDYPTEGCPEAIDRVAMRDAAPREPVDRSVAPTREVIAWSHFYCH